MNLDRRDCSLKPEVYLREYETRPAIPWHDVRRLDGVVAGGRNWFEENRSEIRVFPGPKSELYVGTKHYVGIFPFKCQKNDHCPGHLLVGLPKGAPPESAANTPEFTRSLFRFFDLMSLSAGVDLPPTHDDRLLGFQGVRGPGDRLLLLLAAYYALLVQDLCLRDFRSYYRQEDEALRGRVRGRVHLAGHLRNEGRGRGHVIPCRWEEFTPDNWDNRIIETAARALENAAGRLDPIGRQRIRHLFSKSKPYFELVEDVAVHPSDFWRARLGRVSTRYSRTLGWASLILRGITQPSAAGRAPKVSLDSNLLFERLAALVARNAAADMGRRWTSAGARTLEGLLGVAGPPAIPDILLKDGHGNCVAVGDAKYKQVLEFLDDANRDRIGSAEIARQRLKASDLYQLYCYMRLSGASRGFFVVPFWQNNGEAATLLKEPERFTPSPLDSRGASKDHRLAVLGLNMMIRPADAARAGQACLREWLAGPLAA